MAGLQTVRESRWLTIRQSDTTRTEEIGLEALGTVVRVWRRACGLSQRALAARAGVNQSTISRLETGKLSGLRLRRLARILGILQDPLLGEPKRYRGRWA